MVLAVNAWDESKQTLDTFVKKEKLKQRILLNGSGVAETYHVNFLPTSMWIDRKGVIVDANFGTDSRKALKEKTQRAIAGGG